MSLVVSMQFISLSVALSLAFIENNKCQIRDAHKPMAESVDQDSVRRHNDTLLVQRSIPYSLLAPPLDIVAARQQTMAVCGQCTLQHSMLLNAQLDRWCEKPHALSTGKASAHRFDSERTTYLILRARVKLGLDAKNSSGVSC